MASNPTRTPENEKAPVHHDVYRTKTQEEEDDEYLNSLSYSDLHPYPLDGRAREILERRNGRY